MTTQQWTQAKPSHSSFIYHANDGCDIRHKTNAALDKCEKRIERAREEGI